MIRITDLSLPFDHNDEELKRLVKNRLDIEDPDLIKISINRSSLDARKKNSIKRVYTVLVQVVDEISILEKFTKDNEVSQAQSQNYQIPQLVKSIPKDRPVIVGTGPGHFLDG